MAGGKETPRQKMVGMMYLVLMALLAINVSKSILDAFITQDEQGLEQNANIVRSINGMRAKIGALMSDEQSRKTAKEIEPIFKQVSEISNKIDDHYLSELNELFKVTEGEAKFPWFKKNKAQITEYADLETIEKKDDYDSPSRLFAGQKGTDSYKRGQVLRTKLVSFRDELILTVADSVKDGGDYIVLTKNDLKDAKTFEARLKKEKHPNEGSLLSIYSKLTKPEQVEQHHEMRDWNVARFYHQPMVGVVGTFTSLRNDIRLAQLEASKILLESVDKPMMNINKVEAQVLASTQYLNMGDELRLKVGIVAYDSSQVYDILYREGDKGSYKKDSGTILVKASSPGPKNLQGKLLVEIAGELQEKDWSFDYTVGKPSASVALPDLNVLYRGHPNVVKAVASGFPPDQVKVSCSGCSSFKPGKDGNYIAKVGGGKEATVSVTAGGKKIGFQKFRIFPLPKAQPYFVGKSVETSIVSSGSLKQGSKLTAKLPNSPLNVKYSIKGFAMNAVSKGKIRDGGRSSNGNLSGKMKNILKSLKKGDKVYFESVKVAGPDGKSYPVGGLSFKVK